MAKHTDNHRMIRHDVHTDSGKVIVDPQAPASDYYYHDAGTTGDVKGPGPYSGDYGAPIPYTDANPHGNLPESYVYADDAHKEPVVTLQERLRNAVDVRVVDSIEKERTIRYQTLTVSISPGSCVQVLGKDPTRTKVVIFDKVSANTDWLSDVAINNTVTGFPLPPFSAGGLTMEAEDAVYVLADSSNSSSSLICVYAEYVRSADTRAESYAPGYPATAKR